MTDAEKRFVRAAWELLPSASFACPRHSAGTTDSLRPPVVGGLPLRGLAPFHRCSLLSVSWEGWVECTDFVTLVLWFYREKWWCIISKAEREPRKQEGGTQCLCLGGGVQGQRATSPCGPQPTCPYSESSGNFALIDTLAFHTMKSVVFIFIEGWTIFFLNIINWIWFRIAQKTQWINLVIPSPHTNFVFP